MFQNCPYKVFILTTVSLHNEPPIQKDTFVWGVIYFGNFYLTGSIY